MAKSSSWILTGALLAVTALTSCRGPRTSDAEESHASTAIVDDPNTWMRFDATGLYLVGRERALDDAQVSALRELRQRPWVRDSSAPRTDYLDIVRMDEPIVMARPRSVDEAIETVRIAAQAGLPMRFQGRSHSMNGSSLASPYELQIVSTKIREVCRLDETRIRAGAGISMVGLDVWLRERGLTVPVRNDGGFGPSVGGYVSAGGFGAGSESHGGFWSNVRSLSVIDGRAQLLEIPADDPRFPWFFGSAGQLGFVVAAELDVLRVEGEEPEVPFEIGTCDEEPGNNEFATRPGSAGYYWWSVFVPPAQEAEVVSALAEIAGAEREMEFLHPYRYAIVHRGVFPRLLLPAAGDAVVVGIWMTRPPREDEPHRRQVEAAARIDASVQALVEARGLRRYLSAETGGGAKTWRGNLGAETYAAFLEQKRALDPAHLFNRGLVFECQDLACNLQIELPASADDADPQVEAPAD